MTKIPVSQGERDDTRFGAFTESERAVMHFALQQTAKRIMDRSAGDEYASTDLESAACAFHMASTLAGQVGVTLGEPPAVAESLEIAAMCIAEGDAPFAARMAAEVEEPAAPLGANADIPVTADEDEAAA